MSLLAQVDALCSVIHRSLVQKEGREWARRLREVVPKFVADTCFRGRLARFRRAGSFPTFSTDDLLLTGNNSRSLSKLLWAPRSSLVKGPPFLVSRFSRPLTGSVRRRVAPVRKDVTAGLYGGDYTRKVSAPFFHFPS